MKFLYNDMSSDEIVPEIKPTQQPEPANQPPAKGGEWFFTQEVKFKNDPNRSQFFINLKDFFGFQPEIVGVFKSFTGRNNTVRLGAYMSPELKKKIEDEKTKSASKT